MAEKLANNRCPREFVYIPEARIIIGKYDDAALRVATVVVTEFCLQETKVTAQGYGALMRKLLAGTKQYQVIDLCDRQETLVETFTGKKPPKIPLPQSASTVPGVCQKKREIREVPLVKRTDIYPGGSKLVEPVVNVSWTGAQVYCAALVPGGALPTEVQYERAVGGESNDETYPEPSSYRENIPVSNVKKYPANSLGIYGISFNADEWVLDSYEKGGGFNATQNPVDPSFVIDGKMKVVRSGEWRRLTSDKDSRGPRTSFRCAVKPQQVK